MYHRLLSLLVLLLGCNLAMAADDNDYYVNLWEYSATIHGDNTWSVTEDIYVDFVQPHHGIYFYRPQLYHIPLPLNGEIVPYSYRLRIGNLDIPGYEYVTEDSDDRQNNLVVQIGSEDKTLTGLTHYCIKYSIAYPDDRCNEKDLLFHSILGDGWQSNIKTLHFSLHFDKDLPATAKAHFMSGDWASYSDELDVKGKTSIDKRTIEGTITDIPAGKAVTLFYELPDDYFNNEMTRTASLAWILLLVTVIASAITTIVLLNLKNNKPVPSVEFYPPEGISSAEVGTIIDASPDVSDLTSLIPWFAEKGYLTIEEQPDKKGRVGKHAKIVLHKKTELPADAPKYQRLFMEALFKKGSDCDLAKLGDIHEKMTKAQMELRKVFTGEHELMRCHNITWMTILVPILAIIALAQTSSIDSWTGDIMFLAILALIPQVMAIFLTAVFVNTRAFKQRSGRWGTIIILLIAVAAGFLAIGVHEPQSYLVPAWALAVGIMSGFFPIAFLGKAFRDTDYRIGLTGKLIGLKEFIKTAEKDRLQMLVDEDPEYFYHVLPYAMVFGLSDKWAKQFAEIDMAQPEWFHTSNLVMSHHISSSIAATISHHVSHSITESIAAHSHAPSSGGSGGGGGFAGGGGGGGGGGAW